MSKSRALKRLIDRGVAEKLHPDDNLGRVEFLNGEAERDEIIKNGLPLNKDSGFEDAVGKGLFYKHVGDAEEWAGIVAEDYGIESEPNIFNIRTGKLTDNCVIADDHFPMDKEQVPDSSILKRYGVQS